MWTRKSFDLARHAPPGADAPAERRWFLWLLGLAAGYSLMFFVRYFNERGDLYWNRLGNRTLREGAVMPPYAEVLGDALHGFALLALVCAGAAVYHYLLHWQGSKSIYTMRRLPRRWELHRRCLTLPLVGLAVCAAAAAVLWAVYYLVYVTATPAQCLVPGGLQ